MTFSERELQGIFDDLNRFYWNGKLPRFSVMTGNMYIPDRNFVDFGESVVWIRRKDLSIPKGDAMRLSRNLDTMYSLIAHKMVHVAMNTKSHDHSGFIAEEKRVFGNEDDDGLDGEDRE